jgi:hypothetical protein
MVHIKLERSGGQLGKTLQAAKEIKLVEADVIKKLKEIAPTQNLLARDDFYDTITINGKKSFPIDITLLKGNIKKIITKLEENLKVK